MAPFRHTDVHFGEFVVALSKLLESYPENTEDFQRKQVTRLVRLERQFRRCLIRHKWGSDCYKDFVHHIVAVRKNILVSRPYFRERDTTFKAKISPVLKAQDAPRLYQFDINYQFVRFILSIRDWKSNAAGRKLLTVADQIERLRIEICECNLPLAISQAKIFASRNRKTPLSYMEINQIAFQGMLEGIDKYVGPYHRRFRAVLIGRMLGNMIESNSETFVHFYPLDKRRIYRIRKLIANSGQDHDLDLNEICSQLNKMEEADNLARAASAETSPRPQKQEALTTIDEIVQLIAAAQVTSSSALSHICDHEESGEVIDLIEISPSAELAMADQRLENAETTLSLQVAISKLSLFERKLLKMKGVFA